MSVSVMNIEYTLILGQGKNCRHIRLLTWNPFIGHFFNPVGGYGVKGVDG